ncbi:hypothetical protein FRC06_011024 [Ceratobasidium sp. 370]|nr:hypothetical protein FRC06_011024 [Ceratobasidium sp. 370]
MASSDPEHTTILSITQLELVTPVTSIIISFPTYLLDGRIDMPQITPELLAKQRKAHVFPYPTPPSSVHTASPHESPSSRLRQSRTHDSPELSRGSDNRKGNCLDSSTCWIPTLDEVSRAGPAQRRKIFQRLAEEARRDEQRAASGVHNSDPGLEHKNPAPTPVAKTGHAFSSLEIGAAAFRLIRPSATSPIQTCPTTPRPRRIPSEHAFYPDEAPQPLDYSSFSEWRVDVPESPTAGAWDVVDSELAEEMIAKWVAEDQEYERRQEEERMLRLRRVI